MDIAGIGTEIVECLRIGKMIDEHREQFLLRVYTEKEVRYCRSRKRSTEHFAARWAAKEAVLKCLGTTSGKGAVWSDIEIDSDETGSVKVALRGSLAEFMRDRGIREILVSLSFCRAYATATAIALRRP